MNRLPTALIRTTVIACATALSAVAMPASAVVIASGLLSSTNGGIVTAGKPGNGNSDQTWANDNLSLAWSVSRTDDQYTYNYTFSGFAQQGNNFRPGLSHLIIETSPTFGTANVLPGTSGNVSAPALYAIGGNGASNPGLPGEIYGLKWNATGNGNTLSFSIVTDRDPVWGNFYANGGRDAYAFNAGWLQLLDGAQGPIDAMHMTGIRQSAGLGGEAWFIAVPDTTSHGGNAPGPGTLPVPGTALLLGLGVAMATGMRRRGRMA